MTRSPDGGWRVPLGIDVLTAARRRMARVFHDFPRVCVSFSGGKDSGCAIELAAETARDQQRTFSVLIVDLEAQYRLTMDYVEEMLDRHADVIDRTFWVCLPLTLRNAVSQYQPQWRCWDPDCRDDWVRPYPDHPGVVTDPADHGWDWFHEGMEFEDFTPAFAHWLSAGEPLASVVAIRTTESYNRWRTITRKDKSMWDGLPWTTGVHETDTAFNVYPIYDWRTSDVWAYYARENVPYNRLYDRFHQAGLSIHQARICHPYGDDQRRGLWLYSVIEPETWGRVVARVNGANQGALYARTKGNILGNVKVSKPEHLTWQQFTQLLLATLPEHAAEHYRTKFDIFIDYYARRGYGGGQIPDEGPNKPGYPSWSRLARCILRNDWHCKGLTFSPHKTTDSYARYQARQRQKRQEFSYL